ncbi:MAG: hypothetical protein OXG03_01720 [Gammaproteobacteria bacterium]|nr:hypothetical protein [Gammaproteobacteria bacterium]
MPPDATPVNFAALPAGGRDHRHREMKTATIERAARPHRILMYKCTFRILALRLAKTKNPPRSIARILAGLSGKETRPRSQDSFAASDPQMNWS